MGQLICQAHTKKGECIKISTTNPNTKFRKRCLQHGALSTGPKTPEGKKRIVEARIKSGHMTSPERYWCNVPFSYYEGLTKDEIKEIVRKEMKQKNAAQAYIRRRYQDYTIKL